MICLSFFLSSFLLCSFLSCVSLFPVVQHPSLLSSTFSREGSTRRNFFLSYEEERVSPWGFLPSSLLLSQTAPFSSFLFCPAVSFSLLHFPLRFSDPLGDNAEEIPMLMESALGKAWRSFPLWFIRSPRSFCIGLFRLFFLWRAVLFGLPLLSFFQLKVFKSCSRPCLLSILFLPSALPTLLSLLVSARGEQCAGVSSLMASFRFLFAS